MEKINISVQTLDGILSHNGEILINKYIYNQKKTEMDFKTDLYNAFSKDDYSKKIVPMTLEASVVRLSDVIAYIGRDIEDSIKLGIIKRTDLPKKVVKVLGDNNSKIVDTLIRDIITNSFEKPYLEFSDKVFEALMKLKDWNYKNIYASEEANKNQQLVEELFYELYYCYLKKVEQYDGKRKITQSEKNLYEYVEQKDDLTDIKRTIVDYIAGQTDQYFLKECTENVRKINIEELYK